MKRQVEIRRGENLTQALGREGIAIDQPCGGRGSCGGCRVELAGFGRIKACQFRLPGIYTLTLPSQICFTCLGLEEAKQAELSKEMDPEKALVGVDLGTTTVAGLCFYKGKAESFSFANPQRHWGADVLSRIQAANQGQLKELSEAIWKALGEALVTSFQRMEEKPKQVTILLAGNTTMMHLLLGKDCHSLGKAPFASDCLATQCLEGELAPGLAFRLYTMPGFSAFVGGDLCSGLLSLSEGKKDWKESPFLLLDLGTNAEMILWDGKHFLTCSAAAGPAFEASPLAMKMHAAGMLHLLADLRRKNLLSPEGLLAEPYFASGYPVEEAEGMLLTQEEIRDLQMAKGAIGAGVELLLQAGGLDATGLSKVYLAGGMGFYLEEEDAFTLGLLPEKVRGKILCLGNASLEGLCKALAQEDSKREDWRRKTEELVALGKPISLADLREFEPVYMRHMSYFSPKSYGEN